MAVPVRAFRALCTVEGCKRKHKMNGLCNLHRMRLKKGLPLDWRRPHARRCLARWQVSDGKWQRCTRPSRSCGLCHFHRVRQVKGIPFDRPYGTRLKWPWASHPHRTKVMGKECKYCQLDPLKNPGKGRPYLYELHTRLNTKYEGHRYFLCVGHVSRAWHSLWRVKSNGHAYPITENPDPDA